MGTQNNDEEELFTYTEYGVINENTYTQDLEITENRNDDDPFTVMQSRIRDLWSERNVGMVQKTATITKVMYSTKIESECPQGFYGCAIMVPEMGDTDVIEKFPLGIEAQSSAVTNFSRRAEGYLSSTPKINQECQILVPTNADTSVMCKLISLGDTAGINAVSKPLANSTSAQSAFVADGPEPADPPAAAPEPSSPPAPAQESFDFSETALEDYEAELAATAAATAPTPAAFPGSTSPPALRATANGETGLIPPRGGPS
jgi:hypothetical protein